MGYRGSRPGLNPVRFGTRDDLGETRDGLNALVRGVFPASVPGFTTVPGLGEHFPVRARARGDARTRVGRASFTDARVQLPLRA